MARYTGPKCKLCRREGIKLGAKGSRCSTARCALERREYPPGVHTFVKRKMTAYGLQLREKQKVKRYYGLLEKQFRVYFRRAEIEKGNTGENLLLALERRLDNVVYQMGFARSRTEARQMVRHGHIMLNNKRTTIPSQDTAVGDLIVAVNREKSKALIVANMAQCPTTAPSWLEVTADPPAGKIVRMPSREDVSLPVQEQLIVELLSK